MLICRIRSIIDHIFQDIRCSGYVINLADVRIAVDHLNGKGDGFEGLYADHFINGSKRLYVILSIIFTLF